MKLFFALLLMANVASAKPLSVTELTTINTFLKTLLPADTDASVTAVDLDEKGLVSSGSVEATYKGTIEYEDKKYSNEVKMSASLLVTGQQVELSGTVEGAAEDDLVAGNLESIKKQVQHFLDILNSKGLFKGEMYAAPADTDGKVAFALSITPVTADRRIEAILVTGVLPPKPTDLATLNLAMKFNTDVATAAEFQGGLTGVVNDLLAQKQPDRVHTESLTNAVVKMVTPLFEEAK